MSVITPTRGTAFIGPDGTLQRVVDSARPSTHCPDGIVLYGPDTDSAVICGGSRATWTQVQAWMDAVEVGRQENRPPTRRRRRRSA